MESHACNQKDRRSHYLKQHDLEDLRLMYRGARKTRVQDDDEEASRLMNKAQTLDLEQLARGLNSDDSAPELLFLLILSCRFLLSGQDKGYSFRSNSTQPSGGRNVSDQ